MYSASLRASGAIIAAVVVASPALAQKMERGSFLRQPVSSRSQLIAQVERDPIVAARYARHFGMSDRDIVSYFGSLRQSTIPSTRSYLVWHVNPNGTIGSRNLTLKRGTGVFVDRNGRIVLKKNCGNPMLSGEVARRDFMSNQTVASRPQEVIATPPQQSEIVATQPEKVAPPPIVAPPAVVTPPVVETPPPVIVPPVTTTTTTTEVVTAPAEIGAPQVISGGGHGPNLLPLLAIPILGAAAFSGGHGGGGSHGGPPPVPEPTSIVALTAGVGLVLARRKKKKE